MSVTFSCPDAPKTSHPCPRCPDAREWAKQGEAWPNLDGKTVRDEAVIALWTEATWGRTTCSTYCKGVEEVSVAPEVNFANASARGVLRLMGQDSNDLWGSVAPTEIPAVLQRLMVAINQEGSRSHLVREGSDGRAFDKARMVVDPDTGLSTISRGCRIIDGGNTDEQTLRRLGYIRELLSYAHEHGFSVNWG